jgi:hypothetical protein
MSPYTVSSIALLPIPGVHHGTGSQHDLGFATVVSASVPGSRNLQFVGADVTVTTMLFALNSNVVVPNWFGVAVPNDIQDFTRPNIFFHPTPGQAGYNDADYPNKSGLWPNLFYYMELLGKQVAGAGRSQIVIMPFLTNSATDTGLLPGIWHDTVTDILTQVRALLGADDGSALAISQVVVSSFSDAIIYSHSFRTRTTDLAPLLAEIWDLDGGISSYQIYSTMLESDPHAVIQYDSSMPSYARSFHVPWPRWADFYDKAAIPKTALQVHPLVRDFMFLDAATRSSVGSLILAPAPISVPQAPSPPQPPAPAPSPPSPVSTPAAPIAISPISAPVSTPPTQSPILAPTPGILPISPLPSPPVPPGPGPVVTPVSFPQQPIVSPIVTPTYLPQPAVTPGPTPSPVVPPTGPVPQPGAGEMPVVSALPHLFREGCDCCTTAVVGVVSTVAQTAQAAITAIAAIASLDDEH